MEAVKGAAETAPRPAPSDPLLSIVTPVYNGEAYIEACLRQIVAQGRHDVEHVVVDGGSTDRTVEIVQAWAARHSHIRWVSGKDRGQSDAMNKGIAMARGRILGCLNVDDYYEPGVFNRALGILETLPEPSMVVGNCRTWSQDGRLLNVNRPRRLGLVDLLMGWNANPMPANPSAYFYHRSLHDRIGLYDIEEHYALDLDFILRAVQGARRVVHVDEIWGNFRFIPGTKTYTDCKALRNWDRYDRILAVHRARLPWPQKLELAARKSAWSAKWHGRRAARRTLKRLGLR